MRLTYLLRRTGDQFTVHVFRKHLAKENDTPQVKVNISAQKVDQEAKGNFLAPSSSAIVNERTSLSVLRKTSTSLSQEVFVEPESEMGKGPYTEDDFQNEPFRNWTNRFFGHQITARFIGCKDGIIDLEMENNIRITFRATQFAMPDLIYIASRYVDQRKGPKDPSTISASSEHPSSSGQVEIVESWLEHIYIPLCKRFIASPPADRWDRESEYTMLRSHLFSSLVNEICSLATAESEVIRIAFLEFSKRAIRRLFSERCSVLLTDLDSANNEARNLDRLYEANSKLRQQAPSQLS